jgi:hypothetical protein
MAAQVEKSKPSINLPADHPFKKIHPTILAKLGVKGKGK